MLYTRILSLQIAALHNRYKKHRCFIVATDPSLSFDDLNILNRNHEFCMSVNTIFYRFEKIYLLGCDCSYFETGLKHFCEPEEMQINGYGVLERALKYSTTSTLIKK